MDLDFAVVDERALDASLDVCDAATGPRAGVRLGQHGQFIGELVANQRNRVIDDVGDEELRRGGARGHRPGLGVHRLVDRDVLVEVQAGRPGVRARDHADLGGRIEVHDGPAERRFDLRSCVRKERLGAAVELPRRDAQPSAPASRRPSGASSRDRRRDRLAGSGSAPPRSRRAAGWQGTSGPRRAVASRRRCAGGWRWDGSSARRRRTPAGPHDRRRRLVAARTWAVPSRARSRASPRSPTRTRPVFRSSRRSSRPGTRRAGRPDPPTPRARDGPRPARASAGGR